MPPRLDGVKKLYVPPRLDGVKKLYLPARLDGVKKLYLPPRLEDVKKLYLPLRLEDVKKLYLPPRLEDVKKLYLPPKLEDVKKLYLPPRLDGVKKLYLPPRLDGVKKLYLPPRLEDVKKLYLPPSFDGNTTISVIDMNVFYTNIYVLAAIEHFLRAFFTLEFLIRLVTCPEKKEFLRNIHNIMDVVIILLMWIRWTLDYIITQHADHYSSNQSYLLMVFNSLMGVRVLSVFHLTKYSTALKVMYLSIYTVMKELLMLVMILAAAVLIFGTSMYVAENISSTDDDNPVFENIPLAMWWAVVTMTTLGYGDFVPKHLAGYLVGAMCAITGLLLFAMPIAIVAANFANYYDNITSTAQGRRRKLLVERFSHLSRRRQKSGLKSSTLKSPDYVGTKVKGPRLQVPGESIHPTCNTISGTLDFSPTTDARTEQSFLPKQKMETFSSTGVEVPSNVPARNNTYIKMAGNSQEATYFERKCNREIVKNNN
ncbi:potassium voltage-gated channel protein Shaw [Biomphalaria pfeifferi]|uniref:Potassium voltage-gated channel protein Shaw n=1 Tax=Biomphalaria pfeifferi TaxID=112525 RepID=A0AAD8FMS2_BIOPF|nr:potassium voltage-gated channel protein Shaw [Biomphalaria pfeifferi]